MDARQRDQGQYQSDIKERQKRFSCELGRPCPHKVQVRPGDIPPNHQHHRQIPINRPRDRRLRAPRCHIILDSRQNLIKKSKRAEILVQTRKNILAR